MLGCLKRAWVVPKENMMIRSLRVRASTLAFRGVGVAGFRGSESADEAAAASGRSDNHRPLGAAPPIESRGELPSMFVARARKSRHRKTVRVSLILAVSYLGATLLPSTSTVAASTTARSIPRVTSSLSLPQEQAPVGNLDGWRQTYRDDFSTNVPLGSFPGAFSSKWSAYPAPWTDTTGFGMYDPGRTVSIDAGVLNQHIHTENGQPLVAALLPQVPGTDKNGQVYGRYAVRFRGDKLAGYKMAWMLWPDVGSGKQYGEIDFPEMNLDSANLFGFMHHTNSTGAGDQDYAKVAIDFTQWHTTVIEWSPNLVRFILDGVEVGRSSTRVPSTAMHWVLQTETAITTGTKPSASVAGDVQIDWVAAWAYDKSAVASGGAAPPPVAPVPVNSEQRILDTRAGPLQIGYSGGKPGRGATISVKVAGRAGVPTSGVTAVTMNDVITESSGSGFVTAWPSGKPRPNASNLNVEGVGATVSTLVTVPLGADGKVNLFTQSGGHLVADVAGWLPTGSFVASTPTRILDTRSGDGQLGYQGDRPGAGAVVDLAVAGVGPVPKTGVSAVVLSLTATEAAAPGFVTIWPAGSDRPLASALNEPAAGATTSNQVTVPLGAGGKVSIFTQSGAHLVADVAGYYTSGGGFKSLMPTRILDTRAGDQQLAYSGAKPAGGQTISLPVLGRAGVPASGVGYVVLNLTATDATAAGFVSAWPAGTDRPLTSVLNLSEIGQTRANAVFAPVGSDGSVELFSQSGTDLVVDVTGWLAA